MILKNNALPGWIKRQASLGPNVEVDGIQNEQNAYWYLLTVCCPLIFESYALILHPFWADLELRENKLTNSTKSQTFEKNLKPISWTKSFGIFNKDFDLKTSNEIQEKIRLEIVNDWPSYINFPEEGDCSDEQLGFVRNRLIESYGDVVANYYYCILKTGKWEEDKIYSGKLSELEQLKDNDGVRDNPTAIFPDDKSWCLVTDYDLPFTYIGGSEKFITSITDNEYLDIYRIFPAFIEKV